MERVKTVAGAPGVHVLFADEADLDLNPRIEPAWFPKGEQKSVPAAGQNRRRTIFGAVNYATKKVVHLVRKRRRTGDFIGFLFAIAATYPDGFVKIVIDNCKIHDTKAVRTWLALNPRFEFIFLPTYSPNLNIIEAFWRWLKRKVACNRLRGDQKHVLSDERIRQRALARLVDAADSCISGHNEAVTSDENKSDRRFAFAA